MKIFKCGLILATLLGSLVTSAHGEDKYGPNRGFVRMPGAFHTEVVPIDKNKLKVFLLDLQWKNPSVAGSKLQIKYNDKINAQCEVQDEYYSCTFPKTVDLTKKGKLKVLAERQEQKGMEVTYSLPLKLEVMDDGHGGKH